MRVELVPKSKSKRGTFHSKLFPPKLFVTFAFLLLQEFFFTAEARYYRFLMDNFINFRFFSPKICSFFSFVVNEIAHFTKVIKTKMAIFIVFQFAITL